MREMVCIIILINLLGLSCIHADVYPGYNLFAPLDNTETYLIDNEGNIAHSWACDFTPGNAVYFLEDGSLLHSSNNGGPFFNAGGKGGRVERYDWNGDLIWAIDYNSSQFRQHHDVEYLPNGNIMLIAWEKITEEEALAAGRNPALLSEGELWSEHIIEIEPSGNYGGTIVWEWHTWDHLIQDYDAAKPNFGVISDHPELIDLNFAKNAAADWHHINSVDYNSELDQIILSVHHNSEIWIIDHSTTLEEAAGHSGGNCGYGGDLLYRWGNPAAFGAGSINDQQLFLQHDAEWIENGLPGETNILIFNNGSVISGSYSSIVEIIPPVTMTGCYIPEFPFGPIEPTWTYIADPPQSFFSQHISGAQRLPNGNTLVCDGPAGYFFEVTPEMGIVWDYTHGGDVFRVERYSAGYPGFQGTGLEPFCLNHGDINFDGELTAVDAQGSFLIVLGALVPELEEECAADCNGDSEVTAGDAQMIFQAVLGVANCADIIE